MCRPGLDIELKENISYGAVMSAHAQQQSRWRAGGIAILAVIIL
jgi:hypothetical protein